MWTLHYYIKSTNKKKIHQLCKIELHFVVINIWHQLILVYHSDSGLLLILILFSHYQYNQSRPASKGVATLPPSSAIIVLFPDVSSFHILLVNIIDKVSPEILIQGSCFLFVWPFYAAIVMQCSNCQVVDVDPDRSSPVGGIVFRVPLHVEGI